MYIPSWQGLGWTELFGSKTAKVLPFPLNVVEAPYFYIARSGIYNLFRFLRSSPDDTVLAPAYHHGNEIHAIVAAGWKVRFYSIDRHLQLDLEELDGLCDKRTKAVFVIHYMGWPQPVEKISEWCRRRNLLLIEDCALSLFSEVKGRPLGSFGDYAVFCLYKTLPIPNGGLIVQHKSSPAGFLQLHLRNPEKMATMGRCTELILERLRLRTDQVGNRIAALKSKIGDFLNAVRVERTAVGDTGFAVSKADLAMSALCRSILRRLDYEHIRCQRRENFLFLQQYFAGRVATVFADLPNGVCPLFYPILVRDKKKTARILQKHGIGAVEFWNHGHASVSSLDFPETRFLRDHVLELPIHQDLQAKHLEYLARQVLNLGALAEINTESAFN